MNTSNRRAGSPLGAALIALAVAVAACVGAGGPTASQAQVPHEERWGIYSLNLDAQAVELLYSASGEISGLRLNSAGDRFVFAQKVGGDADERTEIHTLGVDGSDLHRLTDNGFWDLYPAWSPDGSRIAFLTWRESDLDIYVMNADGSSAGLLYDSGSQDADIDWVGDRIAFTAGSRIWTMRADGTDARPLTDPPRAGEFGNTNLPFGDYDPRISPDGTRIVFERLVGDQSPHGNYDLYVVRADGSNPVRLTDSGYSQGLASWSHDSLRLAYVVAAIGETGQYDIYVMNADGTGNHNVTPDFFPPEFLCHSPVFSLDDTTLYIVGEWWPGGQ